MHTNRRTLLAGLGSSVALAGCNAAPPPARAFPDPSFAQDGIIRLDVAEIEVVSTYRATLAAPNVEHRFPVTPERMMQRWARERLQPTGGTPRRARFLIEDASVRENEVARQTGVRALFTTQQAVIYEGSLRATLEVLDSSGQNREGFASAAVTRSQSLSEKTSTADREQAAGDLCAAMMASLNAEMDRQIRAYLGPYLR
jgi:hypothetical protein